MELSTSTPSRIASLAKQKSALEEALSVSEKRLENTVKQSKKVTRENRKLDHSEFVGLKNRVRSEISEAKLEKSNKIKQIARAKLAVKRAAKKARLNAKKARAKQLRDEKVIKNRARLARKSILSQARLEKQKLATQKRHAREAARLKAKRLREVQKKLNSLNTPTARIRLAKGPRLLSAYSLFLKDYASSHKKSKSGKPSSGVSLFKAASAYWKGMSPEEKEEFTKKAAGLKAEKMKRLEGIPKKPASAYFLYVSEHSSGKAPGSLADAQANAKSLGERWRSLTEEEKKKYHDAASKNMVAYKKNLDAFLSKQPAVTA